MSKTVVAVFFDTLRLSFSFCGGFCWYITWLRLVKNLTLGRKRVWAGMTLFGELQGRVGPKCLDKKFVEIVNVPGVLKVFTGGCC
jgi:hypothetical protein